MASVTKTREVYGKSASLKYQRITNDIYEKIETGVYPAGMPLPSNRTLMNEYGVALSTVRQVMDQLNSFGVINTRQGKGTFVVDNTLAKGEIPPQIDLIVYGFERALNTPSFMYEFNTHFSRLCGEKDAGVRINVLDPEAAARETESLLKRIKPKFVIVLQTFNREILTLCKEHKIPYLLWNPNFCPVPANSVIIDDENLIKLTVEHLVGLGHRRIAYLHGSEPKYFIRQFEYHIRLLYEELGRHGIAPDPDLVTYGGFSAKEGYEATVKLFETGKEFTAIIINDLLVNGVYRAIEEHKKTVGKDISVIGHTDLEFCCDFHPALTTVRISRKTSAQMVFEQMQKVLNEPEKELCTVKIPVELMVRESTGPCESL